MKAKHALDVRLTNDVSRYALISAMTGAMDFLLALVLLHAGFSAPFSLAASIISAGIVQYLALELWGFSERKGEFSARRLAGSGLVEAGTYAIRVTVLWLWKSLLNDIEPTEHLIGLAVAYLAAFVFGYIARRKVVFAKNGRV